MPNDVERFVTIQRAVVPLHGKCACAGIVSDEFCFRTILSKVFCAYWWNVGKADVTQTVLFYVICRKRQWLLYAGKQTQAWKPMKAYRKGCLYWCFICWNLLTSVIRSVFFWPCKNWLSLSPWLHECTISQRQVSNKAVRSKLFITRRYWKRVYTESNWHWIE